MLTEPLYVVQTWALPEGDYGVELAAARVAHPSARLKFVTRDRGIYQDALDAEGHDVRLVARWHQGYEVRVLDELLPAMKES